MIESEIKGEIYMKTRQQAITYGLTFPHTYVESPFKDPNWELVRVKGSKKAFLWVYEKDGYINLNIKVDPIRKLFYFLLPLLIPNWDL